MASISEPSPRWAPYSAAVDGRLCVFGGRTKDFSKDKSELSSRVHSFNQCRETWDTRACTGPAPPGLYRGTCTTRGHHLYTYGGYGGSDGLRLQDSLHQLDTRSVEWSQLPSGPSRKVECGLASYEDQLILFGGFGIPSGPTQPGAEFVKNTKYPDGHGYTNELHSFSLKEGEL